MTSDIEHALELIHGGAHVFEVRILRAPGAGTVSGYFDLAASAAKAVAQYDGKVGAIYVTLNPAKPDLLARASNRLKPFAKSTTADPDILHRRWLLLDFDPRRPSDISATDAEHEAALGRAGVVRDWLRERGWGDPFEADSGNGAHLLYAIDLPNDDASRKLIERVLNALALYHSDESVELDTTVGNAARITKLYGTVTCKGDSTSERPHRRSKILSAPTERQVVTLEQLESVAALLPATEQRAHANGHAAFDIEAWLSRSGLPIASQSAWQGGTKWVFEVCPWNSDHTNRSAFVVQHVSGAIAAGCHHNGCASRGWRDLVEPGGRDDRPKSAERRQARPTIEITENIPEMVDEAISALRAQAPNLYVRAMQLVQAVHDDARAIHGVARPAGTPVIAPIGRARLRELLAEVADWERYTKDGEPVPKMPPMLVADTIMQRGEWPFPQLAGVVGAPTLRTDLSILQTPGYDEASGLLFEPAAEFPPIPSSPTQAQALAAIERLADPFRDFAFGGDCDRSATLALILSMIGRHAINGSVPMFVAAAYTAGTGKTLLMRAATAISTGREPAVMAACNKDDEMRKRLTSIVIEGLPAVLLDNVGESGLGCPSLAAALTTGRWTDRALGENRTVSVPFTTVIMASGNNIALKADLSRRVIPIYQDAALERPELRTGFAYPDLCGHVRAMWMDRVCDGLTVLRAYAAAGLPAHGKPALGSFEAWDRLVRGALLWCGLADPVTGTERVRAEADVELDALRTLLATWMRAFGGRAVTAAEVIEAANYNTDLRDAFDASKDKLTAKALGMALRRWMGRIVGGYRLVRDGENRDKVALWRVQITQSAGTAGTAGTYSNQPDFKSEEGNEVVGDEPGPGSPRGPRTHVPSPHNGKTREADLTPVAQRILRGVR